MKREIDLVRLILKDLGEAPSGEIIEDVRYHDRYDPTVIHYNMKLLIDEGFVVEDRIQLGDRGRGILSISLKELTWKGNDFLDAARDDSVWQKAKQHILKPGASFTFDVLLEWLKAELKSRLGLP